MRRALIGVVLAGVMAGVYATVQGDVGAPVTFSGLLAERAKPNVQDLAARSQPSMTGEPAQEAFLDLLRLRDVGDASYVGELTKVLEEHGQSSRIHRFAAAQALFCIGTDEAHAALKTHLLTREFPVGLSVLYIRHWDMDQKKATEFLERYHLVNLGKGLAVTVDAKVQGEPGKRVARIGVTTTNRSRESVQIEQRKLSPDEYVFWKTEDGPWVMPDANGIRCWLSPTWVELKPGESRRVEMQMAVRIKGEVAADGPAEAPAGGVTLPGAGTYRVKVMINAQDVPPDARARAGLSKPWFGRVVSDEVEVNLRRQ